MVHKYILIICSILVPICYGIISVPPGFKMGVATASYQIEGGWNSDGKGENIWDRYTHLYPQKIKDASNGNVACDSYDLWKKDIELLKSLNVHFYRFSLSWTRILPTGFSNEINPKGIEYYDNLIDALMENGIEPMVTLYHWDLPQTIQDLGGWTNPLTANYFADFAEIAFNHFGDRVKNWITINEPSSICVDVYEYGNGAPGIKSPGIGSYICGKNILLAHAKAYRLYQDKFKQEQQGKVGITIDSIWAEPKSNNKDDLDVADREMQMSFGWFAHPIFSKDGDYPNIMKSRVSNFSFQQNFSTSRLPPLSPNEVQLLRGSADFLGLNHYHTWMVDEMTYSMNIVAFDVDKSTRLYKNSSWSDPDILPWGFRKLVNWIKDQYDNPLVYVTENGIGDTTGTLNDYRRIEYIQQYVLELFKAVQEDGCKVQRYTVWSLMDNMEWTDGYTVKFGLYQVDFNSAQRIRSNKSSAYFYAGLCNQSNKVNVKLV